MSGGQCPTVRLGSLLWPCLLSVAGVGAVAQNHQSRGALGVPLI